MVPQAGSWPEALTGARLDAAAKLSDAFAMCTVRVLILSALPSLSRANTLLRLDKTATPTLNEIQAIKGGTANP